MKRKGTHRLFYVRRKKNYVLMCHGRLLYALLSFYILYMSNNINKIRSLISIEKLF
jgi:hypothetical protein